MDGRTDMSPLERSRIPWTTGMLFPSQGINPGVLSQGDSGGGGYRPGSAASAISSLAQLQTRYLPPSMHGSVGGAYNSLSGHFGGLGSSPLGGDSPASASGLDPYRTLVPTLHHYWTPPTPHTPGMEGQYGLSSGVFPTCLAPVADPNDHVFSPCTTPLAGLPQHALHRMYDLNTDYKYSGPLSPPSASSALANAGAHQERLQRELAQSELQKQLSRASNKSESRHEVIKSANQNNKERSKSHERHERCATKASGHLMTNGGSETEGGGISVTEIECSRKSESAQSSSNPPTDTGSTLVIDHDVGKPNEKKRTKVILGQTTGHEHGPNERPTVRLTPRAATPKTSPKETSKPTTRTINNNSEYNSRKKTNVDTSVLPERSESNREKNNVQSQRSVPSTIVEVATTVVHANSSQTGEKLPADVAPKPVAVSSTKMASRTSAEFSSNPTTEGAVARLEAPVATTTRRITDGENKTSVSQVKATDTPVPVAAAFKLKPTLGNPAKSSAPGQNYPVDEHIKKSHLDSTDTAVGTASQPDVRTSVHTPAVSASSSTSTVREPYKVSPQQLVPAIRESAPTNRSPSDIKLPSNCAVMSLPVKIRHTWDSSDRKALAKQDTELHTNESNHEKYSEAHARCRVHPSCDVTTNGIPLESNVKRTTPKVSSPARHPTAGIEVSSTKTEVSPHLKCLKRSDNRNNLTKSPSFLKGPDHSKPDGSKAATDPHCGLTSSDKHISVVPCPGQSSHQPSNEASVSPGQSGHQATNAALSSRGHLGHQVSNAALVSPGQSGHQTSNTALVSPDQLGPQATNSGLNSPGQSSHQASNAALVSPGQSGHHANNRDLATITSSPITAYKKTDKGTNVAKVTEEPDTDRTVRSADSNHDASAGQSPVTDIYPGSEHSPVHKDITRQDITPETSPSGLFKSQVNKLPSSVRRDHLVEPEKKQRAPLQARSNLTEHTTVGQGKDKKKPTLHVQCHNITEVKTSTCNVAPTSEDIQSTGSIPVGIATIARQRTGWQNKTGGSTCGEQSRSTARGLFRDRSDRTWPQVGSPNQHPTPETAHRDIKSGSADVNLSVSGHQRTQGHSSAKLALPGRNSSSWDNNWRDTHQPRGQDATSNPWLSTAHSYPPVWLGQTPYLSASLHSSSVDSSRLPLPLPAGYKLAQDSLSGQVFLLPDSGWSYPPGVLPTQAPFLNSHLQSSPQQQQQQQQQSQVTTAALQNKQGDHAQQQYLTGYDVKYESGQKRATPRRASMENEKSSSTPSPSKKPPGLLPSSKKDQCPFQSDKAKDSILHPEKLSASDSGLLHCGSQNLFSELPVVQGHSYPYSYPPQLAAYLCQANLMPLTARQLPSRSPPPPCQRETRSVATSPIVFPPSSKDSVSPSPNRTVQSSSGPDKLSSQADSRISVTSAECVISRDTVSISQTPSRVSIGTVTDCLKTPTCCASVQTTEGHVVPVKHCVQSTTTQTTDCPESNADLRKTNCDFGVQVCLKQCHCRHDRELITSSPGGVVRDDSYISTTGSDLSGQSLLTIDTAYCNQQQLDSYGVTPLDQQDLHAADGLQLLSLIATHVQTNEADSLSPDINKNYNAPKASFFAEADLSPIKEVPLHSQHGQPLLSDIFRTTNDPDNMDAMEVEMRTRLAELQRRYREKQRQLARLQPGRDRHDDKHCKRGPGRPRKRKSKSSEATSPRPTTPVTPAISDTPQKKRKHSQTTPTKSSHTTPIKSSQTTPFKSSQTTPIKSSQTTPIKSPSSQQESKIFSKSASTKHKPHVEKSQVHGNKDVRGDLACTTAGNASSTPEKLSKTSAVSQPVIKTESNTSPVIKEADNKPVKEICNKTPKKVCSKKKASTNTPTSAFKKMGENDTKPVKKVFKVSKVKHPTTATTNSSDTNREWYSNSHNSGGLGVLAQYAADQIELMRTSVAAATSAALKSKKKRKHPDGSGLGEFQDEAPVKKRKPGRPRKYDTDKGGTETIVAKKRRNMSYFSMAKHLKKSKSQSQCDFYKRLSFCEEAWFRRRSERIFLSGATKPSPSKLTTSITMSPSKVTEITPSITVSSTQLICTHSRPVMATTPKPSPMKSSSGNPTTPLKSTPSKTNSKTCELHSATPTPLKSYQNQMPDGDPTKTKSVSKICQTNASKVTKAKPLKKVQSPSPDEESTKPSQPKTSHKASQSNNNIVLGLKGRTEKQKNKIRTVQELSQKLKKKYKPNIAKSSVPKTGQDSPVSSTEVNLSSGIKVKKELPQSDSSRDSDSSSDQDDVPLIALVQKTIKLEPVSCKIRPEDLKDGLQVLYFRDSLFYVAEVKAIQAPDIYGVVVEGERRTRPHILSREEILKEAVLNMKPPCMEYLTEGRRVCAYWSQQFSCLYPGCVTKGSPNPHDDSDLISVEFDDGDSGKISIKHVRLLPQDFPIQDVETTPILMAVSRRCDEKEMKPPVSKEKTPSLPGSSLHCPHSENAKVKRRGPGRPPKQKSDDSPERSTAFKERNNVTKDKKKQTPVKSQNKEKTSNVSKAKKTLPVVSTAKSSPTVAGKKKSTGNSSRVIAESAKNSNDVTAKDGVIGGDVTTTSSTPVKPVTKAVDSNKTGVTKGDNSSETVGTTSVETESSSLSSSDVESDDSSSSSYTDDSEDTEEQDESSEETDGKTTPAKGKRKRIPSESRSSKIAAFLPARQLWHWSGNCTRRPGMKGKAKKDFYKAIQRGQETLRVGECAVFLSTGRPNLPYVGRIESLWQGWGGSMVVKVKWFYHPEETKGGKRLVEIKGALYESPHVDENDVQTISHKCEVVSFTEYKSGRSRKTKETDDVYYLAGSYEPTLGIISFQADVKVL